MVRTDTRSTAAETVPPASSSRPRHRVVCVPTIVFEDAPVEVLVAMEEDWAWRRGDWYFIPDRQRKELSGAIMKKKGLNVVDEKPKRRGKGKKMEAPRADYRKWRVFPGWHQYSGHSTRQELVCDGCGRAESSETNDIDQFIDYWQNEGWMEIDYRWYCPPCVLNVESRKKQPFQRFGSDITEAMEFMKQKEGAESARAESEKAEAERMLKDVEVASAQWLSFYKKAGFDPDACAKVQRHFYEPVRKAVEDYFAEKKPKDGRGQVVTPDEIKDIRIYIVNKAMLSLQGGWASEEIVGQRIPTIKGIGPGDGLAIVELKDIREWTFKFDPGTGKIVRGWDSSDYVVGRVSDVKKLREQERAEQEQAKAKMEKEVEVLKDISMGEGVPSPGEFHQKMKEVKAPDEPPISPPVLYAADEIVLPTPIVTQGPGPSEVTKTYTMTDTGQPGQVSETVDEVELRRRLERQKKARQAKSAPLPTSIIPEAGAATWFSSEDDIEPPDGYVEDVALHPEHLLLRTRARSSASCYGCSKVFIGDEREPDEHGRGGLWGCGGCGRVWCQDCWLSINESCDNCYEVMCAECFDSPYHKCDEADRFSAVHPLEERSMSIYASTKAVARERGQLPRVGGYIYCRDEPYEIVDFRRDEVGEVYTVRKPEGGEYEVRRNLNPKTGSAMGHWTRFRYSCGCPGWRYNRHCKHTQGLAQALGERQSYCAVDEPEYETPTETLSRWFPVRGQGLTKTLGIALIGSALVYAFAKIIKRGGV